MADRNPILPPISDSSVQFNTDALAKKDQEAEVAVDTAQTTATTAQTTATTAATQSTTNTTNITNIISGTQTISSASHFHADIAAPKYPAGKWIPIFRGYTAVASNFVNNGTNRGNIFWCLAVLPNGATVDQMAIQTAVTNATTNVRLGLYSDLDGVPDTLLVDAGTVSIATTGIKTANIGPLVLGKGRYWLAVCFQSTATTAGAINGFTSQTAGPSVYKYSDNAQSLLALSFATHPAHFTISGAYTSGALPASAAGLPFVDTGGTGLSYGPLVTMRTA
jgi:hypothetical protein